MINEQIAIAERQAERALDDMEAITGVPLPRRSRPQPAPTVNVVRPTFHNINIRNSTVGVVNQAGELHHVDAAVTVIRNAGETQLAAALKTLTESAMAARLPAEQQKEAAQILSVLASEATVPSEGRRTGAARPLLHRLRELLSAAADFATVVGPALDAISTSFGL